MLLTFIKEAAIILVNVVTFLSAHWIPSACFLPSNEAINVQTLNFLCVSIFYIGSYFLNLTCVRFLLLNQIDFAPLFIINLVAQHFPKTK